MEKTYYIIDFDSTFVNAESVEELAEIALENDPKKEEILEKMREITSLGMEGKIGFNESLRKRVALLSANKQHLEKLNKRLKKKITPSILRNEQSSRSRDKKFFKKFKKQIYIVSGGFREFIVPVVTPFGILEKNVLANTFKFDKKGNIVGFDEKNLLSQKGGKAKAVKNLKLVGEVIVLGDGYTDWEIKNEGAAHKFVAFAENVARQVVLEKADLVVNSFDEFLYEHNLPMAFSYPKSRIKVLLLENIDKISVDFFEKEGYFVELLKDALDEEELVKKIKGVNVLGVRSKTKVSAKVLEAADRLIAVGAFSVGVDQIDLAQASKNGVAIFNAPFSNTRSVVELVIGEIIMLLRHIFEKSTKLHKGFWDKSAKGSFEVRGKKLGIIGYGNIGSQVSVLAESLGMDVYFFDLVAKLSLGNAKRVESLEELLKKVDVVSVHVAGNLKGKPLIAEREFKLMKDGAIFLNLSRGGLVDLEALAKFIKLGKVAGAAIDVFPNEPKSNNEKFKNILQGLPNMILTPHIGGSTEEAQKDIGIYVSGKIIEFINTGSSDLSVNLPNIQLPEQRQTHRFLHLHQNVPGVLAQINGVLAKNGLNILGQYLKTNDEVGYVITDVDKNYDKRVIEELKEVKETIKFRVLY